MTEQMCIFFAACFILRGHDMHIDFLQFVSGRHDLPSDVRAFFFLPLLICKLRSSFLAKLTLIKVV